MKLGEAKNYIKEKLNGVYDESEAANIGALILEDCTGIDHNNILLHKEKEITKEQQTQLDQYIQRLQQHEPVQYIINKAWFYGMELYVDNTVLVPRPETEELVDWIVKDLRESGNAVFQKASTDADATTQLKILDVGTGSGCIALAIKKTMSKAEVWGCDVSEEALNVARRNGSALNIRVDFQGIDFLNEDQQKSLPTVNIIVSNPPYIPASDKEQMQPNVINHEPNMALFVPNNDPLVFYRAIAHFVKKRLYTNGLIYLEIHENLGSEVLHLFKEAGYQNVELRKDMQGKERMIKAWRNN